MRGEQDATSLQAVSTIFNATQLFFSSRTTSTKLYPNSPNHLIFLYFLMRGHNSHKLDVDHHNKRLSLSLSLSLIWRGSRRRASTSRTEHRRQRTEDRGQRTEDRGQRTEDRGQDRTEVIPPPVRGPLRDTAGPQPNDPYVSGGRRRRRRRRWAGGGSGGVAARRLYRATCWRPPLVSEDDLRRPLANREHHSSGNRPPFPTPQPLPRHRRH